MREVKAMDKNIIFKFLDWINSIPFLEGNVILQSLILTAIAFLIAIVLAYLISNIHYLYDKHKRKTELKETNAQFQIIKEDVLKEYSNNNIILSVPKEMRNNTLRWQANVFKVSYEDLERHIDKYFESKLDKEEWKV